MKIAIIGSGIAGLAASHFLQKIGHEVHLYESQNHIGMSAHTIDLASPKNGSSVWGDVPSRMFNGALWPSVVELYQSLGAAVAPIKATQSYRRAGEASALKLQMPFQWSTEFRNSAGSSLRALGRRVGVGKGVRSQSANEDFSEDRPMRDQRLKFLTEINRLRHQGMRDLVTLKPSITFQQYLDRNNFSTKFREAFLFPALSSTVCTCSHEALLDYPAVILLEAMQHISGSQRLCRVVKGARWVSQRLIVNVNVSLATPVREVHQDRDNVSLTANGNRSTFDHVVIAVQANQATGICSSVPEAEAETLEGFQYENVDVVVHTDEKFMPALKSDWGVFNFAASNQHNESMCTVWMNKFHTNWHDDGLIQPVFQTIRPIQDVRSGKIICQAKLQRPVVNSKSWELWRQLRDIHQQPNRRIWFCGSYAMPGIPLLQSAVQSAKEITELISKSEVKFRSLS